MATLSDVEIKKLLHEPSSVTMRPSYEGGNINTAIGFKCDNYLLEAAVLDHFRAVGLGATELYLTHGVNFDVVGVDTRLHTVLTLDDDVRIEVVPKTKDTDREMVFATAAYVERDGETKKAVSSKLRVLLRRDPAIPDAQPLPAELERFVVDRFATAEPTELAATEVDDFAGAFHRGENSDTDPVLAEIIGDSNAVGWKWKVPYYYCHFTERMQMSGYLRQMEEAKHLFVASRGISIKRLLDERGWIPVVTSNKIQFTDETVMEENLYTVYTVESIFKDMLYTSRMDFYVVRDGKLVKTATGSITHGYCHKETPESEWQMAVFDDEVLRALRGE
ncbi:thioesterase family protein [Streptomyces sp. XM4193]|uniref:thioesterase family protein n=1 Tax=Streptomyces sp. XM4193 TaxID=2929782 RepID=UPI001FFBDFBC|nr:thioesterase family protein [Streptomyces sp. XM4193]MCK1795086.1 thioesterase family protein [Streptomyces sp. XM4193]